MEQEKVNSQRSVLYYILRMFFFFALGCLLVYFSLTYMGNIENIENVSLGTILVLSFGVSILFVVITSWGLTGLTKNKK